MINSNKDEFGLLSHMARAFAPVLKASYHIDTHINDQWILIMQRLEQRFHIQSSGSTVGRECLSGLTTFLAMSYIIFVNPQILHIAGMNFNAVFVATCVVGALATLLMALMANQPVAVAPAMAMNTYFTYVVVLGHHIAWPLALGAVFISGVVFLLISLSRLREWFFNAIPTCLQRGVVAGIGLFIAMIGLQLGGMIVANPHRLIQLAPLHTTNSLLFFLGVFCILLFEKKGWSGGILAAIVLVGAVYFALGLGHFKGVFAMPPSIHPTLFALRFPSHWSFAYCGVVFSFVLVALFDAVGTLLALKSVVEDTPSAFKQLSRGLVPMGIAASVAGLIGTSSTSPYLESATGILSGGRTGLSSVVTALLLLLCLFLSPLASSIPAIATAPALLVVGFIMVNSIWQSSSGPLEDWLPSLLTAFMVLFSGSIAKGFGVGVLAYMLMYVFSGRGREIHPFVLALGVIFIVFFALAG